MSVFESLRGRPAAPQLETTPADLQLVLLELRQYGCPTLRFTKIIVGWVVSVDMQTNGAGLKFDVSSEHGHETPLAAALECLERVRKAVQR